MPIRRGIHNTLTGRNVDTPFSWLYASSTERLAATGFTALDVGRYAWQADDDTIWMLKDDSPITWVQTGGDPVYSLQDQATVGSTLITNGTFDSDLSGWTYQATPAGTVTTTGSDANVTGAGTNFLSCFRDGDSITIAGVTKTIAHIYSDTLLTVTSNFGANAGAAFSVVGGWSFSGGKAAHVAGNSIPLSQSIAGTLVTNSYYYCTIVVTRTAGSILAIYLSDSPGGLPAALSSSTTIRTEFKAAGTTQTFEIVPNSTFAGTVDTITLYLMTANSSPAQTIKSADGTTALEIRSTPSAKYNVLLGVNAGAYAYFSFGNVAIGQEALQVAGVGQQNVALGYRALYANLTGYQNIGLGYSALQALTTGIGNVGIGVSACQWVSTGRYNLGIGYAANIQSNGSFNIGIGPSSLWDNYVGSYNLAIGANTLYADQASDYNVAIGYNALPTIKSTAKAISAFADYSTTVPGTVQVTSNSHGRSTSDVVQIKGSKYYDGTYTITKIDANSFYIEKTFIRNDANTFTWWLLSTQNGSKNIGIGYQAGSGITYGSGNLIIGNDITGLAASTTNNIILGSGGTIRLRFDGTSWTFSNSIISSAGRVVNTTRQTTTYTALVTDDAIFCDTDGGGWTLSLPAGVDGQRFMITNCGSSGNDLVIDGDGSETIDGETTQTLIDGESVIIIFETTEKWRIF